MSEPKSLDTEKKMDTSRWISNNGGKFGNCWWCHPIPPIDDNIGNFKKETNIPCAFFATRSRRSSTMMLNRCDMSPQKRKIFIVDGDWRLIPSYLVVCTMSTLLHSLFCCRSCCTYCLRSLQCQRSLIESRSAFDLVLVLRT